MAASEYRAEMTVRFTVWDRITGVTTLPTTA
jgi:putative transposase